MPYIARRRTPWVSSRDATSGNSTDRQKGRLLYFITAGSEIIVGVHTCKSCERSDADSSPNDEL